MLSTELTEKNPLNGAKIAVNLCNGGKKVSFYIHILKRICIQNIQRTL